MKKIIYSVLIVVLFQACKKTSDDTVYSVDTTGEAAQQVGDMMASVDESGGSTSGGYATNSESQSALKAYARLSGEDLSTAKISNLFLPEAQADACSTVAFGACSANKKIRTFGGCTVGTGGSISGDVTITFSDAACGMGTSGQTAKRVPNFTVTGLRGATFNVTATTTNGQILTRGAGAASTFTNEGIRRTFVTPKGSTILDVTTTTGTAINITGASRTGRTMSGGSLIVTNNLTNDACTLTPTGITWGGGCSCPTAGYWTGTCSPSSKTFKITFNPTCGSATVENTGETTQTITLDRCGS